MITVPHRAIPTALMVVLSLVGLTLASAEPAQAGHPVHWQAEAPREFGRGGVTAADITGDGRQEVLVGNLDGHVYAYTASGAPVPGWPARVVVAGQGVTAVESTPAVADLGDGRVSIVVGAGSLDVRDQQGGVVVLNADGTRRCSFQTIDHAGVWPPSTPDPDGYSDPVFASPAIGDVTGDGNAEIVFGSFDNRIYVITRDCAELARYDNTDTVFSSPALYNIDGVGGLDILIGGDATRNPAVHDSKAGGVLLALSYVPGRSQLSLRWRQRPDEQIASSPAVGDITGNGRPEVVVGTGFFYDNADSRKVFAFDVRTGDPIPGWPRTVTGETWSSPALGDVDGDGVADVVIASGIRDAGRVHALRGDGSQIWTVDPCAGINGCGGGIFSSPVIADLDGDGTNDVVVGHGAGVFLLDGRTGRRMEFQSGLTDFGTSAVADLGGQWALISSGYHGGTKRGIVRAHRLPAPRVAPPWPQFHRTASNLGAPASAIGGAETPVERISGSDRIATAVAASQRSFGPLQANAAVLAKATDYPDALAGTPLAERKDGPLLLTHTGTLDDRVAAELQRILPRRHTVYVLGGRSAIDASVERQIEALGFFVRRLGGVDRFETAVRVAREGLEDPDVLLLATGGDFPDALSAGAAAPLVNGAVLLTAGDSMPRSTADYLAERGADVELFAIGGHAARAVPQAEPLVGTNRFDTARKVAQRFASDPHVVGVVSGENFPDALGGGAHTARLGGVLLLSGRGGISPVVDAYLRSVAEPVRGAYLYGGQAALTTDVQVQVHNSLN